MLRAIQYAQSICRSNLQTANNISRQGLKFEKQQPIISDLRSFIGLLYIFKINFYPEILGWNIPALKTKFCEMRLKLDEKSRIQPHLKHHQLRDHPMRNQR